MNLPFASFEKKSDPELVLLICSDTPSDNHAAEFFIRLNWKNHVEILAKKYGRGQDADEIFDFVLDRFFKSVRKNKETVLLHNKPLVALWCFTAKKKVLHWHPHQREVLCDQEDMTRQFGGNFDEDTSITELVALAMQRLKQQHLEQYKLVDAHYFQTDLPDRRHHALAEIFNLESNTATVYIRRGRAKLREIFRTHLSDLNDWAIYYKRFQIENHAAG